MKKNRGILTIIMAAFSYFQCFLTNSSIWFLALNRT